MIPAVMAAKWYKQKQLTTKVATPAGFPKKYKSFNQMPVSPYEGLASNFELLFSYPFTVSAC